MEIWQIKVKLVLLLHFLLLFVLHPVLYHAVSSLKKVACKICVPVAVLAEEIWDAALLIPLFPGLAQLRPFFSSNQLQTCSGLVYNCHDHIIMS